MTMGQKGNLVVLKVAVSPKSEKPLPPKLVCMHVTSIPTRVGFKHLVLVLKSALSTFFEVLDGAFKPFIK